MPFLEVHAVDQSDPARRRQAAAALTDAVGHAFSVPGASVDIYFLEQPAQSCARAGVLPAPADQRRTFVKLHAFARSLEQRRAAARAITAALAAGFDISPDAIVVYFLERARHEAAHGGILASEEGGA